MLIVRNDIGRNWIVKVSAIVIGAVSLFLLVTSFDKGIVLYEFPSEPTGIIMFIIEILIAVFILYLGIKFKNYLVVGLVLLISGMML
jgi:ech hydrogenase subunit A